MKYFHDKGAPKEKLIMGMPMYGQSFTLASSSNNGLNAAASGAGNAGPFTRQAGMLAYNEICDLVKHDNWSVQQQPEMGPYAFKGNQWVGYDDVEMIREKVNCPFQFLSFCAKNIIYNLYLIESI